jgi:dolichol-phosphate mannosyltransferase
VTQPASNTATTPDWAELGAVLVIIPTYNEAENIGPIVARLRAAVPDADVLIADDNSPDGTGRLADDLAAADEHVHVLHREAKQGLGATYVASFRWGLERGYGVLVEHDADGSHQPEQLPSMLRALRTADMVKGSRWVRGGSVVNWPWHRKLLSQGGSLWSRTLLGLPIKDVTGGFTAFRADTLRGIGLDGIESAGYAFQVDLARRAVEHGYTVAEVPIEFIERERGDSKMSGGIVAEAMLLTTRWGLAKRTHQFADWLGYAKDNATTVVGEVGDKVGPEVAKYAEQAQHVAHDVGDKVVSEAQRLSREVSKLAAEASDKLGPEVEKYAAQATHAVAELTERIKARVADTAKPSTPNKDAAE